MSANNQEYDEVVSAYEQDIRFIVGFAGSGKSTRLAEIATPSTLVLTPTHRAAKVLKEKGVANVGTIHSALKLIPTIDQNFRRGQKLQKLKRIGETDLSDITDVFIDEFSMISAKILDILLEVLPAKARVKVFGDPYQLPPVGGEKIEPEAYTDDIIHLTNQYRAEAPEVVETFMRYMLYLKGEPITDLRMNLGIQHGSLEEFNPETDRILAYTNKRVQELNAHVAQLLDLQPEYVIGDALIANGMNCTLSEGPTEASLYPKCMAKGTVLPDAELMRCVGNTENDIGKFHTDLSAYSRCNIDIDGTEYNIYYDTDHYSNNKKLEDDVKQAQFRVIGENNLTDDIDLPKWCRENRGAVGVQERGWAWSKYLAHSSLVFNLQRPFATTVHKAQGSEFDTVFIDQKDIKRAIRNDYYADYARLMYVALSRAIKRVIII